jgi:hypothetical protein
MHAIPRSLLLALLLLILAPAHAARDFLVDADWLATERDNNPKPSGTERTVRSFLGGPSPLA